MPRRKAEYKFLGREKWDSQSDDGKIFLALFRERTVGNVRHAAPLDPVLNNFDSVVKYICFGPDRGRLVYQKTKH